jgi:hypothetical protein
MLTTSGFQTPPELGFHQGVVISWDAATGTNRISVSGTEMINVPGVVNSDSLVLHAGDRIAIIRYLSTYFIIGRVSTRPSFSGFLIPVPMTPTFESVRISGTAGAAQNQLRLNASSVFGGDTQIWEGRLCSSSGRVRVDGVWGTLSGGQTLTYKLKVDGVTVGTWVTFSQLIVGPLPEFATFDVSNKIGRQFVRIEITVQSSVNNTDLVACQLLGLYQ